MFLVHARSSRSSWAAEGIREDGGRGGAHSHELGECVHGNQEKTEREEEKRAEPNFTLSSSCIYSAMFLSKPESRSSVLCDSFACPSPQFPCLEAYVTYCCNQVGAKALLDQKKHEKRVEEFLRLCQESSFSRKLDLWNFLDLPRSRLVKYPLLLKEIQKCTPPEHPDEDTLPDAVSWCLTHTIVQTLVLHPVTCMIYVCRLNKMSHYLLLLLSLFWKSYRWSDFFLCSIKVNICPSDTVDHGTQI